MEPELEELMQRTDMEHLNATRVFTVVHVDEEVQPRRVLELSREDFTAANTDEEWGACPGVFDTFEECAEHISEEYDQPADGMIRPYGVNFLQKHVSSVKFEHKDIWA